MILADESLLDRFRGPGICERCERYFRSRDAAHIVTRGLGGGHRVDIPANIVSLCRRCHATQDIDELKRIVERREKVRWSDIIDVVRAIQRLPKRLPAGDDVWARFSHIDGWEELSVVSDAVARCIESSVAAPRAKPARPEWYKAVLDQQRKRRRQAYRLLKEAIKRRPKSRRGTAK